MSKMSGASDDYALRNKFGTRLSHYLSPSRPLQTEEFLRGRAEQLSGIEKAVFAPGRHVLIHGLRGVGKSSLAQTAAYKVSRGVEPIIVSCDPQSTFKSIIKDIFDDVFARDPRIAESTKNGDGALSVALLSVGASAGGSRSVTSRDISEPLSVNDAVRVINFLVGHLGGRPVFVVDEFDLVTSADVQRDFANFVKQISDKHIPACFIFCGIADSAEALMSAHASIDRYFHAVALGKLPWEARLEIIDKAASALDVRIDKSTQFRIAMISDGFPYYIHFLAEKLFWRVFESDSMSVTPEIFEAAMNDAAASMDMKLRRPYERATQKYEDTYSTILFAVADGHEMRKRTADIFAVYQEIMRDIGKVPLDRAKYNARMNRLKDEAHGRILTASRQGWYEFSEKMIRGYVRLKAEQAKVRLNPDHPEAPKVRI